VFNWINGRLSFGARLGLLGALFMVPIALLLVLFIKANLTDLNFSLAELAGARYLPGAWSALAQGTAIPPPDGRFQEADARTAFAEASAADRMSAGLAFITAVEDGSNLTLDPDLDSFYAQDAVAVRLPALLEASSDLRSAITAGDASAILLARDHLWAAANQANGSLSSSIKDNPTGSVRAVLEAPTQSLAAALAAANAAQTAGAPAVMAALKSLDEAVDHTWQAGDAALIVLLRARIDGLKTYFFGSLGAVAVALLAVGFLVLNLSRGLTRRIGQLVAAMTELSGGDTEIAIPCRSDRNETGLIAAALETFKTGLQDRVRLQAEAAVVHSDNAEKLRALEAEFWAAGRDQTKIVEALSDVLARLADADLTARLPDDVPIAYAKLSRDFESALKRLEDTLQQVRVGADGIMSGANEIARASDDLSRRTEQQAASLE
jgi:methyl-accepting chemotaxis protein